MYKEIITCVLFFQSHGVKFIFTLVGGHISPILVACEKLGIRVIDTRHEVSKSDKALGHFKISTYIGVRGVGLQ